MEKKIMEKNSNNWKVRWNTGIIPAAVAAILAVTAIALTTCKPMFLQDIAGYVPVYSPRW